MSTSQVTKASGENQPFFVQTGHDQLVYNVTKAQYALTLSICPDRTHSDTPGRIHSVACAVPFFIYVMVQQGVLLLFATVQQYIWTDCSTTTSSKDIGNIGLRDHASDHNTA